MPRSRPPPKRADGPPARETGGAPSGAARRFSADEVANAVRALEAGVPAPLVCRRLGVSDRTLYRWRRAALGARRPT